MNSEKLNEDVLFEIAVNSDLDTIRNLCSTNPKYNTVICNNENFWHQKFKQDYFDIKNYNGSWKRLYLDYGTLYTVDFFMGNGCYYPMQIISNKEFKPTQIDESIAVDRKGSVWVYKNPRKYYKIINDDGLGWIRLPGIRAKMACANDNRIMFVDYNDDVYFYGSERYDDFFNSDERYHATEHVLVPGIKARQISLGYKTAAIIDKRGSVYMLGQDSDGGGILGLGVLRRTKIPDIVAKQVYLGHYTTVIIDINDELYVFGDNSQGKLGLGHDRAANTPQRLHGFRAKDVAITVGSFFFIDLQDNLWASGHIPGILNDFFTEPQPIGIKCKRVLISTNID